MKKVILVAIIGSFSSRLSTALELKGFEVKAADDFMNYYKLQKLQLQKLHKIDIGEKYFQRQKYIPPKHLGKNYLSTKKRRY